MNTLKLLALGFILYSLPGGAQELSPRAYWPSPVGTNVLTMGYAYTSGEVIPDRSLPLAGVDSSIHSLIVGYRHTFSLWDRTTNFTLEAPYLEGTTKGAYKDERSLTRAYNGFWDVAATFEDFDEFTVSYQQLF